MQSKAVRKENPLGTQPVGRLLLKFAIPSIVAMVVNSLYNIVDQIFIGQGVGHIGNAATTVAFPIVTIMLSVALLIGVGGSALASIRLGEKREEEAEHILGNVFTMLAAAGIVIAILGLVFLKPLLFVFGARGEVMPYAIDYTAIILLGAPFMLVSSGLSNMARADGSPNIAMIGMLVGAGINVVLDPVLIFVFHMGVQGAAIATIFSQFISAAVLAFYFVRFGRMRLIPANLKPNWALIGSFTALGISNCMTQLSNSLLQTTMNNSLVYYGDLTSVGGNVALSAMGIVLKVSAIIISVNIGIATGAQPILGYNKGAKNYKRVKHTYLLAILCATVVVTLGWFMIERFPAQILSLFGTESQEFNDFGVRCLQIFMFGIFCSGYQIVSSNYFQATGQPLKATILSLTRQVLLLIPLVLLLPLWLGLDGILYAGPVADIGAAVLVTFFIVKEMRKLDERHQVHVKQMQTVN